MKPFIFILILLSSLSGLSQNRNPRNKAVFLEDISWTAAKDILTADKIIVIPLGASAKMHGPHLPLSTDFLQAQDCANRIALERNVIIAPSINYVYYPIFVKFAGSTTLSSSSSVETILNIVRGLSEFGPKRFYVINQGISTVPSLKTAASILAEEGILFYYSDFKRTDYNNLELSIATKPLGGQADEIETSNVLSIRPDLVNMRKAVDDSTVIGKTGIPTPVEIPGGILNPSGVKGYATPATKEKGRKYMEGFAKLVVKDIDSISTCMLPAIMEHANEYKIYEGEYSDSAGTKLLISLKGNSLFYVWNNRDQRNFFPLYKNADDHFSALPMQILFVRNEKGQITKAWCQNIEKSFWVSKMK